MLRLSFSVCLLSLTASASALQAPATGNPAGQEPAGQEPGKPGAAAKDPANLPPGALNEVQTRATIAPYRETDHWALRAVVLLGLGNAWHPVAAETLVDALGNKDERLGVYALEALRRTDDRCLRKVLTPELVDQLVKSELKSRNELYLSRVMEVLARGFPDQQIEDKRGWQSHWRAVRDTYAVQPWIEPKLPTEGERKSSAQAFVERAFDLYQDGLEVAICIDSTGSMQSTIDAARDALEGLVLLLEGVTPDLRLGLVHYKETGELSGGAQVLEPLTKKVGDVRKRLARLVANGGGDIPERIEGGLTLALDVREMGWRHETNKLIVVIGDAPAHPEGLERSIELVREAHENPFGLGPGAEDGPRRRERGNRRTSARRVRPFVTSTIGVGEQGVATITREHMQQIAGAGGGSYAEVTVGGGAKQASALVMRQILTLSFGQRWASETDLFVRIFLEYHDAGLIGK